MMMQKLELMKRSDSKLKTEHKTANMSVSVTVHCRGKLILRECLTEKSNILCDFIKTSVKKSRVKRPLTLSKEDCQRIRNKIRTQPWWLAHKQHDERKQNIKISINKYHSPACGYRSKFGTHLTDLFNKYKSVHPDKDSFLYRKVLLKNTHRTLEERQRRSQLPRMMSKRETEEGQQDDSKRMRMCQEEEEDLLQSLRRMSLLESSSLSSEKVSPKSFAPIAKTKGVSFAETVGSMKLYEPSESPGEVKNKVQIWDRRSFKINRDCRGTQLFITKMRLPWNID